MSVWMEGAGNCPHSTFGKYLQWKTVEKRRYFRNVDSLCFDISFNVNFYFCFEMVFFIPKLPFSKGKVNKHFNWHLQRCGCLRLFPQTDFKFTFFSNQSKKSTEWSGLIKRLRKPKPVEIFELSHQKITTRAQHFFIKKKKNHERAPLLSLIFSFSQISVIFLLYLGSIFSVLFVSSKICLQAELLLISSSPHSKSINSFHVSFLYSKVFSILTTISAWWMSGFQLSWTQVNSTASFWGTLWPNSARC